VDTITVEMKRVKETKNTWRYEATEDDQPVDTQYIRKSALKRIGDPDVITVTITPSA
jgi:hypothetical protein